MSTPFPLDPDGGVTPEGRDSTIGDAPTPDGEVLGPEELDDVTADGSTGDGTLGDGELASRGDVLGEMLSNHGSGGWSDDQGTDDAGADAGGE